MFAFKVTSVLKERAAPSRSLPQHTRGSFARLWWPWLFVLFVVTYLATPVAAGGRRQLSRVSMDLRNNLGIATQRRYGQM